MALLQPFYAPGIMYNTIKAGCAVDYPVITGSQPVASNPGSTYEFYTHMSGGNYTNAAGTRVRKEALFNFRFPFESIIEPHTYIPISSSIPDGITSLGKNRISFINLFSASADAQDTFFDWQGAYDNKYSMAANNFFGEVPNFFLKEAKFKTFTSKPENQFKAMKSGSTYYMDIDMYMTEDMVQCEGPSNVRFNYPGDPLTDPNVQLQFFSASDGYTRMERFEAQYVDYRGGLYGPACQFGHTGSTGRDRWRQHGDPAFAPYTPPYFYGRSTARVSFTPHKFVSMIEGETNVFTLDEILARARVETVYTGSNPALHSSSHTTGENYLKTPGILSQMRVSSSINLFGKARGKQVQYNVETLGSENRYRASTATDSDDSGLDRWVISPKFECPILNFSGNMEGLVPAEDTYRRLTLADSFIISHCGTDTAESTSWGALNSVHTRPAVTFIDKGNFPTASIAVAMSASTPTRGMWSGYGSTPSGSTGIFFRLRESFPEITYGETGAGAGSGSLLDVCGFAAGNERLGELAEDYEKTIHEAVVAIPFIQKGNKREFFPINREQVDYVLGQTDTLSDGVPIPGTSIKQMATKLQKYIMPPHLDFIKQKGINPFVVYIFEFTHALKQDELRDIWQNIMPEIAMKAEKQEVAFSHPLGPAEFFEGKEIPPETQWMVFKIKQRAQMSYYAVTADSTDDDRFAFQFKTGGEKKVPDYSYNWPYDFFSLVELKSPSGKSRPPPQFRHHQLAPTSPPQRSRPVPRDLPRLPAAKAAEVDINEIL